MSGTILYGSLHSGHSYKVRLALLFLGVEHEYCALDLEKPRDLRDSEWLRDSPYGEVPLFVTGGRPIAQSNAILLDLARAHRALGWEHPLLEQWLFWEANRIGLSLPNYRLARLFKPDMPAAVSLWMHQRMMDDLQTLDQALIESQFLLGDTISAADIACSAYLFYHDVPDLDLANYPSLSPWLARIQARRGWRAPLEIMGRSTPRGTN